MTKLKSSFDAPEVSPGFLLWQLTNKWQARQREALKPYGLTHVQFVLLASLTWSGDAAPMTQKQLALHAQVDVMMTSQVLRALEHKGFICRNVSHADKRSFVAKPTQAGIDLANRAVHAVEEVDMEFFGKLGDKLPTFISTMRKLA